MCNSLSSSYEKDLPQSVPCKKRKEKKKKKKKKKKKEKKEITITILYPLAKMYINGEVFF